MRPVNPMSIIPKYAKDSTYIDGPTQAQQEAGMIPLDTVPADWWNKLFQQLSEQVNNACNGIATAYDEILNVLSVANIQPDATQNDQLARAITNLRQTVANAANAGAVKSSATSGKVSVDANGIMTPNGMGVPTALNTTTKEIVSAINELKSVYDQTIQSINSSISALSTGKAPNNHAAAETTYGVGNGTQYGHLKLSDSTTDATLDASKGFAATPAAVSAVRAIAVSSFVLPVGTVLPFAGATVPVGYFLCDGSSYLRTAYPALFKELGTRYNLSTDGGEVFRVPDLRNRTVMGANPYVTGKAGGNTSNVGDVQNAQLPTFIANLNFYNMGRGDFNFIQRAWGGAHTYLSSSGDEVRIATDSTYRPYSILEINPSRNEKGLQGSTDHLGNNVYTYNGEVRTANIRMNYIIKY